MNPTDEQADIITTVSDSDENIIVDSLAGTGKTTILKMMDAIFGKDPALYLAFNRKVVDDAEEERKRVAKTGEGTCFRDLTNIRTFNGCGHRVWSQTVGKVVLEKTKTKDLLKVEIEELKGDDKKEARDNWFEIISAISKAKSMGYVPDGKFAQAKRLSTREEFHASLDEKPTPFISDLIDSLLITSIKLAYKGTIDFDDQIYMPTLFGGTFPRFPRVLIDEGQDLNRVNHAMCGKLCRDWTGIVGDPWQSIYGFRGAVQEGMEQFRQKFSCTKKTISISFRCPRAIVEAVQWRVPHYKWVKDGGEYNILSTLSPVDIPDGAAIICRNNAPLFRTALQLLSCKRSVQVAGSDIGPKIVRLLQKVGAEHDKREDLLVKIDGWKQEKLETSQSPGTIIDTAECMKVFASFGATLSQAVAYAEHLFAQQGTIQLLTGHKAKGREWDVVFHLDPWLIGEDEQEKNLRYVITTRAKRELHEINSGDINWS